MNNQGFFNIQPYQKIASIGVGGGLWEVILSFDCQHVVFYLMDLQAEVLHQKEIDNSLNYFTPKFNKQNTCHFEILIQNAADNWPIGNLDKVLFINSLHEIDKVESALGQAKYALKPTGQLIIEEELALTSNQIHEGCGKRLFTAQALDALCGAAGFTLVQYEGKLRKYTIR